jgi:hypothetical protein
MSRDGANKPVGEPPSCSILTPGPAVQTRVYLTDKHHDKQTTVMDQIRSKRIQIRRFIIAQTWNRLLTKMNRILTSFSSNCFQENLKCINGIVPSFYARLFSIKFANIHSFSQTFMKQKKNISLGLDSDPGQARLLFRTQLRIRTHNTGTKLRRRLINHVISQL